MRIIRPAPINDASLTSSSVPEAAPAAYNAGTTYSLGALASVLTGTVATVYESLQAVGNADHPPASSPAWWRKVATTYSTYDPGVTYALGDTVIDPVAHRTYESAQAGNIAKPLTDKTWWLDTGPTNRWRMFDQSNGSRTLAEEYLKVDMAISGRVNSVAILGMEASTAQIIATVNASEVYNKTFALTSTAGISDWYNYFFEPIVRKPDLIITDIPNYSNTNVSVILTRPDGTIEVGTLIVGQSKDLGLTLLGASAGIVDYSRKDADAFGNYFLLERAFSKRLDARVVIDNSEVDNVVTILSELRATPVVWQASTRFNATGVFGFYRNFSVTLEYPTESICLLEIEGLT